MQEFPFLQLTKGDFGVVATKRLVRALLVPEVLHNLNKRLPRLEDLSVILFHILTGLMKAGRSKSGYRLPENLLLLDIPTFSNHCGRVLRSWYFKTRLKRLLCSVEGTGSGCG